MTKTQDIFEQHLRLAASYTSKEAADHEEPEIDLARIPSDDLITNGWVMAIT